MLKVNGLRIIKMSALISILAAKFSKICLIFLEIWKKKPKQKIVLNLNERFKSYTHLNKVQDLEK
jgi:hypothetical protein